MWSSALLLLVEIGLVAWPLANLLPASRFWPQLVTAWAVLGTLWRGETPTVDRVIRVRSRTQAQRVPSSPPLCHRPVCHTISSKNVQEPSVTSVAEEKTLTTHSLVSTPCVQGPEDDGLLESY
ncbi:unnamed protein product, partial [Mesorhabditis spiculigera]